MQPYIFRVLQHPGLIASTPILPSPTPSSSPPAGSPTPTPSNQPTLTPTKTNLPTPTPTPTITLTPTITPTFTPTSTPTVTPTPLIYLYGPFKNMIIKAEWAPAPEPDADISVSVKSAGYSNSPLGYCYGGTTLSDSLSWAGDSKTPGYEYFAIDFNSLSSISPSTDPITIGLSGAWFSSLPTNTNITFTYTIYASGNISKSGFTFISDAAQSKQSYSRAYNLNGIGCVNTKFIQDLVYLVNQDKVLVV